MNRWLHSTLFAAAVILSVGLVHLWIKLDNIQDQVTGLHSLDDSSRIEWRGICRQFSSPESYCPIDLNRLAVYGGQAEGDRVQVSGYLTVDRGSVVLYADEQGYLMQDHGRSIEIRADESQLRKLFGLNGYMFVKVSGEFHLNLGSSSRGSDRLGMLVPPIRAFQIKARSRREGVEDILVHPDYID